MGIPPRIRFPMNHPDEYFRRQQHISYMLTKWDCVEQMSIKDWTKYHEMIWGHDEEMLNLAETIIREKLKIIEDANSAILDH